jgi:hypothetical protein
VNIVATVPPAQERTGDFSNTNSFDGNGNLVLNQIFDPFTTQQDGTRATYVGNKISQQESDPIGQALLNYYPNQIRRATPASARTTIATSSVG